jgi:predicted nucleic acid-binding protein
MGHAAAVDFLEALERSERIQVLALTKALEDEALEWLRRRDEREYSFVDATSFALMRAHKIMETLAFDGDFRAAGFVELRL